MGHLIQLHECKMFSLRNLDDLLTKVSAVIKSIKGGFGCCG